MDNDIPDAPRRPSHQGAAHLVHSPPSLPAASQPDKPFNLQNRRLQLRNSGFRGALLAPRNISPRVQAWTSPSRGSQPDEQPENPEPHVTGLSSGDRRIITPSSQARSVSNILLQLSNSSQRPSPSRPSAYTLFQTSPSPSSPGYQLPSRTPSPVEYRKKAMKAGRGSGKSPFGSLERQKGRGDSARATRRDTSRYIEHLETQLAATMNNAESAGTPVSAAQISKIKSLTAEVRVLKQELTEWEETFEERIQEEIGTMMERETKSRAKIRALEKDTELKDNKIRELEWEVEMGNRRLRNLEAVKITNRNLERRVDVLTELLAHSPMRNETDAISRPTFDISPDTESAATNSTARPKSMFSRLPLSPVRRPFFHSMAEPQSIPSILEEACSPPQGSGAGPFAHTRGFSGVSMESGFDSGLGESCSLASTRAVDSQRSSMMSQASSNSSIWGTSFSLSPELQGRFQNRQRQMRRFPSGSNSLKPLILPAAASAYSPTGNLLNPVHAQDASRERPLSPDPGTCDGYLQDSDSPKSHEATLNALEGNTYQYQTFEEALSGHTISDAPDATYSPFDGSTQVRQLDASPYIEPAQSTVGSVRRSRCISGQFSIIDTVRGARHMSNRDITAYSLTRSPPSSRRLSSLENLATEVTWLPLRYIKDFISQSLTAARRILINAWHANWTKFRKASWWIIGFVLGKRRRSTLFANMYKDRTVRGSCPQHGGSSVSSRSRPVSGTRLPVEPDNSGSVARNTGPNFELSGPLTGTQALTRSVQLWARFSFALVLAVGLAVRDGPDTLMCDCLRVNSENPHSDLCPGPSVEDEKTVDIDFSDRMVRTPSPHPPPLSDPSDYTVTPLDLRRFEYMERDGDGGTDASSEPGEPG